MNKMFLYQNLPVLYTEYGKGTTVILLHGFAENGAVWKEQVKFLQQHCRLIVPEIPSANWQPEQEKTQLPATNLPAYELPAFLPNTDHPYHFEDAVKLSSSIDAMADAVAALIKEVAAEKVILLGHSMGGYITLAVAEKYPHLLKGFGLIHSTAFADTDEKKETRRKGIAFIQKNGSEAFFKTSAPSLFSEQSKQQMPGRVEENIAMATGFHPALLIANYEAMMARPDRTTTLSGNVLPVLFVIGKEDKAAPAADVLKQVHLPQVSYFHLLDNVAHMGMWEATEMVNRLILKFIEDCA